MTQIAIVRWQLKNDCAILAMESSGTTTNNYYWGLNMTEVCGCRPQFTAPYPQLSRNPRQSVTSRLETSRYRDFSQFFESIGLGLENFGLEKKSRYRSRKYLVSKKSLGIGLENFGLKKSLGIGLENFGLKKVSVTT